MATPASPPDPHAVGGRPLPAPAAGTAQELTMTQRATAATVGAIATSLLMTPFDVVKHRLQAQQQTLALRAQPAAPTLPASCPPDMLLARCGLSHRYYGVSDSFCRVCSEPIPTPPFSSARDALVRIARSEGVPALWRGLAPALAMSVPATAMYYASYERLRELAVAALTPYASRPTTYSQPATLSTSSPASSYSVEGSSLLLSVVPPLIAGSSARAAATIFTAPFELARTRAQTRAPGPAGAPSVWAVMASEAREHAAAVAASVDGPCPPSKSGAVESKRGSSGIVHSTCRRMRALAASVAHGGPGGLYRGLSATLCRDVPFSAVYWLGYEWLRPAYARWGKAITGTRASFSTGVSKDHWDAGSDGSKGLPAASAPEAASQLWGTAFAAGASAGALAALVTHPFDVVKTRFQAGILAPDVAATAGSGVTVGSSMTLRGAFTAVLRESGWRGLFTGLAPRVAKVGPACAVMISTYEIAKRVTAKRGSDVPDGEAP